MALCGSLRPLCERLCLSTEFFRIIRIEGIKNNRKILVYKFIQSQEIPLEYSNSLLMWGQDLTAFDPSHEAFLRSTLVENSLEPEQESDNHRLIFKSGGSGALNILFSETDRAAWRRETIPSRHPGIQWDVLARDGSPHVPMASQRCLPRPATGRTRTTPPRWQRRVR